MRLLYRLQTHAGLTAPEGTAALVLCLALGAGLAAQSVQRRQAPVAADFYAASDAAFAAALAAPPPGGTPAGLTDAGGAPFAIAPGLGEPGPSDPALSGGADEGGGGVAAASAPEDLPVAAFEVPASAERRGSRKAPPVKTNVNTADLAGLQRLPRVGPAIAQRILEHRQQHGRFRRAEDLLEIKGIGPKTLEHIAPWVTL